MPFFSHPEPWRAIHYVNYFVPSVQLNHRNFITNFLHGFLCSDDEAEQPTAAVAKGLGDDIERARKANKKDKGKEKQDKDTELDQANRNTSKNDNSDDNETPEPAKGYTFENLNAIFVHSIKNIPYNLR